MSLLISEWSQDGGVPGYEHILAAIQIKLAKLRIPLFPHPTAGQLAAVSPAKQAPLNSAAPSEPDQWLHETSVKVPVKAPCPDGKKAAAPPVSSQMSKLLSGY